MDINDRYGLISRVAAAPRGVDNRSLDNLTLSAAERAAIPANSVSKRTAKHMGIANGQSALTF